jgi:hypothetical protein
MHTQLSEHVERSLWETTSVRKNEQFICEYFMKADNVLEGFGASDVMVRCMIANVA